MSIPIYLYMGMLEGGKTTQIKRDIERQVFKDHKHLLLIQCEDGVVPLDAGFLSAYNVDRVFILDPRNYTRETLCSLVDTFQPDGVILECQGIWPLSMTARELPRDWEIRSSVYCANAMEFEQEFKNMDRLIAEKIRVCQRILFHSATKETKERLEPLIGIFREKTELCYLDELL